MVTKERLKCCSLTSGKNNLAFNYSAVTESRLVVDAVQNPVTVKMRIGWDDQHIYAFENARAVERAGGSAVSVHGRTREQLYTGKATWDIIKDVKEAVAIPVVGNGDVFSPEDAKRLLDHTGLQRRYDWTR